MLAVIICDFNLHRNVGRALKKGIEQRAGR
jgi:hypothetical protein